jgi:hypothetical protein
MGGARKTWPATYLPTHFGWYCAMPRDESAGEVLLDRALAW